MIDYNAVFANTNGLNFPDTLSINATGGGATDGTEVVKLLIDDIWGARQAIMDHARLTPDSVTEAPGTAQIIDALQKGMLGQPAGSLVGWLQNDDPATLGARALLLTGQGILRANYQDLDNNLYVGDGNNGTAPAFYHADDAAGTTRNIAGIYLILPDARAMFWRGTGTHGTLQMADGNFYGGPGSVGGSEDDQFQNWQAAGAIGGSTYYGFIAAADIRSTQEASASYGLNRFHTGQQGASSAIRPFDNGSDGVPRAGDETRPVNLGIRWAITY